MSEHLYQGNATIRRSPGEFPRVGAWAIVSGKVGIIAALGVAKQPGEPRDFGLAEFHVVDAQGDTTLSTVVPVAALVQAKHDEIPAARRPDPAVSVKLGYLPHVGGGLVPPLVPAGVVPEAPAKRPLIARLFSRPVGG